MKKILLIILATCFIAILIKYSSEKIDKNNNPVMNSSSNSCDYLSKYTPEQEEYFEKCYYLYCEAITDEWCKSNFDYDTITLNDVIAFAERNKPQNPEFLDWISYKGFLRGNCGGFCLNGAETFDTILYGRRYESLYIKNKWK